jgi:hypothetical protein
MKKTFLFAAAVSAALSLGAAGAIAQAAKLSADSTMGELMDNAKSKEVLTKHIPDIVSNPQMEQAKGMSLRALQPFAPQAITDDKLKAIESDLAKIK